MTGYLKLLFAIFNVVILAFVYQSDVLAHGFGERYDLPLPLWLYLSAAAASVGFSFIILCIFLRPQQNFEKSYQLDILDLPYFKWLNSDLLLNSIKL